MADGTIPHVLSDVLLLTTFLYYSG